MAHHKVLDVGTYANDDVIHISAKNRVTPNRGVIAKTDIANDVS
jgi:hypothetical protein